MVNALEAQPSAQGLKVKVVALGQRLGHVHAEARQLHWRVAVDKPLRERGHGHGDLDGGAGLSARRKRQPLVDHRQDAAIGGIDDHGGAVHAAQSVDGRLANHRILAGRHVARENVSVGEGAGGELLNKAVAARGDGGGEGRAAQTCPGAASGGKTDGAPAGDGIPRSAGSPAMGSRGPCCRSGGRAGGASRGSAMAGCAMRFRQVGFGYPGVAQRVRRVQRRRGPGAQAETGQNQCDSPNP